MAGLVLLAPPGRPLPELVVEQTRYLAELDGTVTDAEQSRIDAVTAAADRIERLNLSAGDVVLGAGCPYWESLQEYDAFETAQSVDIPILVCHSSRDYQVTTTDIDQWRDALGSQSNVQFETYPQLNHLFISGDGPATPSEYQNAGNVNEQVITDISAWLDGL